ncbi:SCO family protein [Parablastomonas sp. CN1-191]|uniref:SCO family protein n=1 Tax=Parablastomonas sp. CN1-191 TaxID=3400908 RepID=UPI003BF84E94
MNRGAMPKPFQTLALLAFVLAPPAACSPAAPTPEAPLAGAAIGGPFTLTDRAGKAVTWQSLRGRWVAIYFGYTFCPDACPTDVGVLMRAVNAFAKAEPARAARLQPIFVTVDPARDTPARMGEFADAFQAGSGPRLLALTGTSEQVAQAIKAFRVFAAKGESSPGGYLMDHSRFVYLMDPDGKPIDMVPVDKGADASLKTLQQWVR